MISEIDTNFEEAVRREAVEYYQKTRETYEKTGYEQAYRAGQTWDKKSGNMKDMLGAIMSDMSATDRIRVVDKTIMYSINPSGPIKEKMVEWYINCLRSRDINIFKLDMQFQESPVTNPDVCVTLEGRRLTPDFLRTVMLSREIQKYCFTPGGKYRIVELGGGSGHLARMLKLLVPDNIYVDIDIPETLHFAYIFLRLNFPEAKTCYVTDPGQILQGIEQYDFVFIPTKFAESILPYEFDLFCNTASLGEMSNANIRQWMDFVQNKLKVRYFFGMNRYLNTIPLLYNLDLKRTRENESSVLFDGKWKILNWELAPSFARCPFEEPCRANQNLEVVAERLADINEDKNREKSLKIIKDLLDEDWVRCRETYLDVRMRVPLLANDLTMNGMLFKLWDSIRLFPNQTNVALMMIYLSDLTRKGYPFEEWYYYRNLLKSLAIEKQPVSEIPRSDLAKYALSLAVTYNPWDLRLLCHYFMRLFPEKFRLWMIVHIGKAYSGIRRVITKNGK